MMFGTRAVNHKINRLLEIVLRAWLNDETLTFKSNDTTIHIKHSIFTVFSTLIMKEVFHTWFSSSDLWVSLDGTFKK